MQSDAHLRHVDRETGFLLIVTGNGLGRSSERCNASKVAGSLCQASGTKRAHFRALRGEAPEAHKAMFPRSTVVNDGGINIRYAKRSLK